MENQTKETRKAIDLLLSESFKELALKKPIEKITIKEITGSAGVIRPTFYNHFRDKYELMEWIVREELMQPMLSIMQKGQYYEVPYRALVTNEISNLLVAGRCASGSFAAQASFRIQPTCMSMGEAAGIAAAWGLAHGITAKDVRWEDIPQDKRSYVSEA